MASVINICNIALARIGNSRTINSLTEKTKEAYTCNLFYESMRDAVLADNDWNFAMSRVVWLTLATLRRDGCSGISTRPTVRA